MGEIVMITAVWLIAQSFWIQTKNVKSALVFKIIPFFLGICCLYVGAILLGFLKLT